MGAWGVEPFDNDDAADWAAEFDGVDAALGVEVLRRALNVQDSYVESNDGSAAVAAAQVVAWLVEPLTMVESSYCEAAVSWVRRHAPAADPVLVADARRALGRVRGSDSELAELWADADDDAWRETLDRIDTVLTSAN